MGHPSGGRLASGSGLLCVTAVASNCSVVGMASPSLPLVALACDPCSDSAQISVLRGEAAGTFFSPIFRRLVFFAQPALEPPLDSDRGPPMIPVVCCSSCAVFTLYRLPRRMGSWSARGEPARSVFDKREW